FSMLSRNNDSIDPSKLSILVLSCQLSFTISAKKWKSFVMTDICMTFRKLVRKIDCHRHEVLSFIDGVTKHETVITSSHIKELSFTFVNTDSDILRLFTNSYSYTTSVCIKALI